MPLSFRGLFTCLPFLDLVVGNATQNMALQWVADFTPGGLNYVTIAAYTTLGTPVAWAIVSHGPGPVGAPVGAVDPNDATIYRIARNNAANVLDVANTIRVTATADGITRAVDIVIKPAVVGLAVVADHFTFQDAAGAHYALDLTNHAITPAAASLTSDVQVQTTPATPAAWSHVLWGAVDTAAANAIYALTIVDARTRGIRLDGLKTIQTRVLLADSQQVMPAPLTVAVRAPLNGVNLGGGLALDLHQFTFAGAGRFAVTQEDAGNFNVAYPAGWDAINNARPQAYTANTAIAVNAVTLVVTGVPGALTAATVRASAYFLVPTAPAVIPRVYAVVVNQAATAPQNIAAGAPLNTQVAFGNLALGVTPNAVLHENPLLIFWEVSTDGGGTWSPLRLSGNTTYVTARAPVATTQAALNNAGFAGAVYTYDSLLAMSCDAAAGLAGGVGTAAAVQAAIAGLFAPANPNPRVQRLNRAAGGPPTQLQYWFNFLVRAPAQTLNGNTAVNGLDDGSLFTNPLGNIACGVWANLLLALWALHGKGDGRYVEVEPRGPGLFGGLPATANVVANSRFSVQNWSFNNTGNLNANNYTHAIVAAVAGPLPPVGLNNQAAPITNGVAGQNNANPPEEFYNHFIVRDGANDSFYDPSYGAVALTRAQWLDASLAGLQSPGNQAGFVSVNLASPNGITTNVAAVALYDYAAAAWVP